ncbi:hypothetical protein DFJ73DRAFT_790300 [Zopfochytrium polystomum]|nr:hypothetical protein DFJ73DRAFT_790300 [Zopfochytrium polystomum]
MQMSAVYTLKTLCKAQSTLSEGVEVLIDPHENDKASEDIQSEEIAQGIAGVQAAAQDLAKFGRYVKLKSFAPFKSAVHALENMMDVTEAFLEIQLGVAEKTLAGHIKSLLGYNCVSDETVQEITRGLRLHGDKLLKQLRDGDFYRAQLGLGHSYSRAKVKFNVNRADNMIIQAINLLDQLDKDCNTFAMRVREWYSWHFPELVKIVNDNLIYAKCVKFIKNKSELSESAIPGLEAILGEDGRPQASMGTDISAVDMENIEAFAERVISLTEYRNELQGYLVSKMHQVAPNLSALIGESVGARLISHAGSLTNLSKYPASTVQILGAEKALFRALKTRGNTPKYGLIYHSTFIGRAAVKNKGRISRVLANKCSIASRIDCFLDKPTSRFGELLREQVEERLENLDVMKKAMKDVSDANAASVKVLTSRPRGKKGKKAKKSKGEDVEANGNGEDASSEKKKKKKKEKK